MRVFRAQLGLICVRQIQVWPYLSVDEQSEFLDRMDFDAIFQTYDINKQYLAIISKPSENFLFLYENFQIDSNNQTC